MDHISRYLAQIFLWLLVSLQAFGQESRLKQTVTFLADSVGNRFPGSNGDLIVQRFISNKFTTIGLDHLIQEYEFSDSIWVDGQLELINDNNRISLFEGKQFDVSASSPSDTFLSDYIVVLDTIPDSLFYIMNNRVVISPIGNKGGSTLDITTAIKAGARAFFFITRNGFETRKRTIKGGRSTEAKTIPIVNINHSVADYLLPPQILDTLKSNIYIPPSGYKVCLSTKRHEKLIHPANIIGIKKGRSDKYIIVGAHYDALSPDPGSGTLRRGANDNASGVAVMLELARRFATVQTQNNIVFVAFSAEERGCIGSRYFVKNMPIDKNSIIEMINLDMVGKMKEELLFFNQSNDPAINPTTVYSKGVSPIKGNSYLSDHYDFSLLGISTTYFHTGEDPDIHTINDTSNNLNYNGMAKITDFLYQYICHLDNLIMTE